MLLAQVFGEKHLFGTDFLFLIVLFFFVYIKERCKYKNSKKISSNFYHSIFSSWVVEINFSYQSRWQSCHLSITTESLFGSSVPLPSFNPGFEKWIIKEMAHAGKFFYRYACWFDCIIDSNQYSRDRTFLVTNRKEFGWDHKFYLSRHHDHSTTCFD